MPSIVAHVSFTIPHLVMGIERCVQSAALGKINHLVAVMRQATEGWYDAAGLLSFFVEDEKSGSVIQVGERLMPKLVTVLRPEKIQEQARIYVRSYILMPSGVVGLVCMIGGVGSLGYQLLAHHTYTSLTFLASSALLIVGALCGWGQTRYHRYLLAAFPEVYAARMRTAVVQGSKKAKAAPEMPEITHAGRGFVPIISIAGASLIFGASAAAMMQGDLDPLPAVLVPWAGFYWAKLFGWRGIIG